MAILASDFIVLVLLIYINRNLKLRIFEVLPAAYLLI